MGDSYDNALAEPVNGLFKTEVILKRGPWRNLEAVEFATLAWVRGVREPAGRKMVGRAGRIMAFSVEVVFLRQRCSFQVGPS